MKKFFTLILLLFIMTGCQSQQNSPKVEGQSSQLNRSETLIIGTDSEDEFINPVLDSSRFDHLIYRGLMKFDKDNQPKPDLAKSVEVSADGLSYTFQLNEHITFQDGTNLTADDVVFTIESIQDEGNLSRIRPEFSEIKSIKKISDYEIVVSLHNPFPPLLDKLTVGIIPKHIFADKDLNIALENSQPVGTGPYKVKKWEKGKMVVLEANEKFEKKAPAIKTVIFKYIPDQNVRAIQLQTGEIDMTLLQPSQVEKIAALDNVNIYNVDTADYRSMMFNMKKPLWQDLDVRLAFSYAVDRQAVVDGILMGYGFPAYSPIQLNMFNNNEMNKFDYDIDKANELLDQAGWKLKNDGFRYKNGEKLSFSLVAPSTDEVRVNIATYLASQFSNIGADVKAEALDWSVINIEECDAFVLGWGSPFDADDHTYKIFHSSEIGEGYNYGSYHNPAIDELLTKARTISEQNKRKEIYGQFQTELVKNPPSIFIAYLKADYGVNKRVNGIVEKTLGHHGEGFIWNLEEWTLND